VVVIPEGRFGKDEIYSDEPIYFDPQSLSESKLSSGLQFKIEIPASPGLI